MQGYTEYATNFPLNSFVECIWSLKSHSRFFNKRELIIPGGRVEMIFNLSHAVSWIDSKDLSKVSRCTGSYILGPRNRHFFSEMSGAIDMIGVRFRHGGLAACTNVPAHILLNQVVPSGEIMGTGCDDLVERLFDQKNEITQINLVAEFLSKMIHHDSSLSKTLDLIAWVRRERSIPINLISEKTGVHYKKLERTFSQFTGYNPKNFSRVIRFYDTLRGMKRDLSLTTLGLSSGYYDQPHFIRDFKAFTGKSPTQFQGENPTIANLLLKSPNV